MQNFVERFLQTAAQNPGKTALVCMEEKMTYAQLERLSAKIASRLLRRGAKKEKIYPIVLERGFEYIASIIGILRAGAAYSPLSTEYPKDRVAFILKDSNADFVVDEAFLKDIEKEKILSEFPEIHMEDAAIAIYTSGSTGNPKGIHGVADLCRPDVQFINRQRGSGTRVLLDYELHRQGVAHTAVRGYRDEEYTHMNVAAAVLSGRADTGLGVRAAAVALGLDFVPLGTEEYDRVIPTAYAEDARILALLEVIRSSAFREKVQAMGGYGLSRTGEILWEYDGK